MSDALPPPAPATPAPATPAPPSSAALRTIFLIVLIDFLGFGIIIPLLPFYVPGYEVNALKVTLLFSIYSICQFIGAPILGALSDRHGRRPILIISQIGSAAGYVLLAMATQFHWPNATWVLAIVYASRVIDGFTGGNVSTAQAYISDVTTVENRAKGMGLLGAAFGIGFSLGPAIGGLIGHYHRSWPAYIAAALALYAALQTYRTLPESNVRKPVADEVWLHPSQFAPVLRNGPIVQLLLIGFLSMAAFVMMESTITLFLNRVYGWQTRGSGLFFLGAGLVIIVVQGGLIGRLTRKLGEYPLAIAGPVLVAVGMILFTAVGFNGVLWMLIVACIANATGRSFQQPTLSSLLSRFASEREQGVVFGLYHGIGSLSRVFGPIVAGLVYHTARNTGPFIVAAILVTLCAGWTMLLSLRHPLPARAPGPAPAH